MLKITTEKLMLVAGIVWFLAGANILNLGIGAYLHEWGWAAWLLAAGTCAVFAAFHIGIFTKMVGKHTLRIYGYDVAKTSILRFFDKKGYFMMAVMMGGGIALRASGVVPEWFIAFFYTGIGSALMVAGVDFIVRYFNADNKCACPLVPRTWRSAK